MAPVTTLRISATGLLIACLTLVGCSRGGSAPAAHVGPDLVSDQEVKAVMGQWKASEGQQAVEQGAEALPERRLRQVALLQLIKAKLVAQFAAKEHVDLNADQLAAALAAETPSADLGSSGWGKESFEVAMRSALLSKALANKLFPSVAVTEDQARSYFEAHPDQFQDQWSAVVDLAHFQDQRPASDLSARAGASERFSDAARELGADRVFMSQPVNKASPLPPELLTAIPTLNGGAVSQPIAAGPGFWVIHATSVRRDGSQSFEVARSAIEMHLADQQRQGRFNDWLAERLREADIKVSRKYGAWPSDFMSAP
jgi:hypothetical protein